eukprot:7923843-Lingulodinium_polyedra.AAC.1
MRVGRGAAWACGASALGFFGATRGDPARLQVHLEANWFVGGSFHAARARGGGRWPPGTARAK